VTTVEEVLSVTTAKEVSRTTAPEETPGEPGENTLASVAVARK
jgi:hypothetical protein